MKLFMSIVSAVLTTAVASIWLLLRVGNASDNFSSAINYPSHTAECAALSHSRAWRATHMQPGLCYDPFSPRDAITTGVAGQNEGHMPTERINEFHMYYEVA